MSGELDVNEISAIIATRAASTTLQKVVTWCKKTYLRIGPVNFDILLSISYEPGTDTEVYYKELTGNLNKFLSAAGLLEQIKIKDLSASVKFTNKEEAEHLRQTKNIDLIVWGEFTNNQLKKDGKRLSELRLNFTYGHPDDPEKKIRSMVALDLSSRLAVKNYWRVVEDNSFEDIKLVSDNTFYMSIYVIALSLKLFGRIEKSTLMFRSLYDELLKRNDNFKEYIKLHLLNCYELLIFDCIWNQKKYNLGRQYCTSLLELFPAHQNALSNLALFQYRTGQQAEARGTVSILNQLYPNKPITLLDNAFFYILQGKYKRAYECYRKVIKIKDAQRQFVPELLLEFLGEEYENSREPALLYASGMVAYFFSANTGLAKKDLNEFLMSVDPTKYKHMVNHTTRILGELLVLG